MLHKKKNKHETFFFDDVCRDSEFFEEGRLGIDYSVSKGPRGKFAVLIFVIDLCDNFKLYLGHLKGI